MYNLKLFLKSTLRKPLFVIIYVFLIAVSSMAFTSNALETLFAVKSIDTIKKYYRPIGYLSGNPDVREGKEIISKSPYLDIENVMLNSRGKLIDIENPDVDGVGVKNAYYKHTNEVVFAGILINKSKVDNPKGRGYYYEMEFEVTGIEAAFKDYMSVGDSIYIRSIPGIEDIPTPDIPYYPTEQDEAFVKEYKTLSKEKNYIVRAYYYESNKINSVGVAQRGKAGSNFIILPLIPDENTGYFKEIKSDADYHKEMPEKLKNYVEYLNYNRKMLSIIGMKDVSLFPTFQEKAKRYYIVEGRALNSEDDRTKNKVCLIHENFAKLRGLGVGDTIKMEVKKNTRAEDVDGYAMWEDWDIWKDSPGEEAEFEIVGLFNDMGFYYISPYGQGIFVPASCIPEGYSRNYLKESGENNYSFVLKNPEDIESFTKENEKKLGNLGYTIMWVDNSAEMFLGVSNKVKESAVTGAILSGLLMITVLSAVCIIYVNQRKKEYAVAKALGAKTGFSFFCMDMAFCVIAVPGIIAGSIIGQRKMLKDSEVLLKPLEEYAKSVKLSAPQTVWLVLTMLCILAFIILALIICNMVLGKIPLFSLLHGNRKKNTVYKAGTSVKSSASGAKRDLTENTVLSSPDSKGQKIIYNVSGNSGRWKYGYIFKHIVRTKTKTVFFIAMSAGAVLFFGWLNGTLHKYKADIESFYKATVIEGELIKTDANITFSGNPAEGVIPPKLVSDLEKTDYVSKVYTEETTLINELHSTEYGFVDENVPPISRNTIAIGVNDWEKFTEETGSGLLVEFAGGYTGEYFTRNREEGDVNGFEIIVPEQYMKINGLKYGGAVSITHMFPNGDVNGLVCKVVGSYKKIQGKEKAKDIGNSIIIQSQTLKNLARQDYRFLTVKFKFKTEKNRELIKDKSKLTNLVTENGADSYLRLIIWDKELSEVVEPMERVVSLFEVLYPFIILTVAVIGMGFQILMLMRRKKEATLMRLLGSGKNEVWQIMFTGHLLLCVLGIPIGIAIMFLLYKNMAVNVILATGLYFLGNVAGGIIGSFLILKSFKLELLQESE